MNMPSLQHPQIQQNLPPALQGGANNEELDEFVTTLKTQVEIFVNRMKSNSSRGRSITNDSSVQTLFMNTMAMRSPTPRAVVPGSKMKTRVMAQRSTNKANDMSP